MQQMRNKSMSFGQNESFTINHLQSKWSAT